MKFSSDLLKGNTKNLLLSTVANTEMYGYEIVKELRRRSKDVLQLTEGSIYPALHELEKNKLLESRWVQQDNTPDRKYYCITKKGKKQLQTAKAEWKTFSQAINLVFNS